MKILGQRHHITCSQGYTVIQFIYATVCTLTCANQLCSDMSQLHWAQTMSDAQHTRCNLMRTEGTIPDTFNSTLTDVMAIHTYPGSYILEIIELS